MGNAKSMVLCTVMYTISTDRVSIHHMHTFVGGVLQVTGVLSEKMQWSIPDIQMMTTDLIVTDFL